MNWMTLAWPMGAGACLALGLINLRIALGDVRRAPHLCFFFATLAVAAVSVLELGILTSTTVEDCQRFLRWSSLPLVVMVWAVAGFVRSFFGTGRWWLALTGCVLMTLVHTANVTNAGPSVRGAVSLRRLSMWGDVEATVPRVVEGRYSGVEILAVGLVLIFVLDASISLWRTGERRRAAIVGGSIILFFVVSRGHAALVEKDVLHTPYFVSFSFLAVLVAMGHELSGDVFRAAKLNRELRDRERQMDLAARAATLGFWRLDLASNHIWANETARRLFDVGLDEPVDMARFLGTLHPEDREGVERTISAALAGDGEYGAEYRVIARDGSQRWINARGRTEFNERHRPIVMRGVLQDVTDRRRSEEELGQLRAQLTHAGRVSMMGQLASALAHELNQPLGAILRNAEAAELFLQDPEPNYEEFRAIIADIRRDDERAGKVIDRLRSLLKRRDVERRPVALRELLDEVLALARADAAARGVRLHTVAEENLPPVLGDRVHLQQVLLNLIINAMDAVADGPRAMREVIVSAARAHGGGVELAVVDSGPGIPPDRLMQVFDAFFTTKAHGMGMGLPISKTIIEAHGGRISCGPREGATGAVFRCTLPAQPASTNAEEESDSAGNQREQAHTSA